MDFTKKFVKAKNPCTDGFRWFLRHYRDGGDYQELLDALVDDGRVNDACWLLDQFGPTDAVRVVEGIDAQAMVFAGTLHVRGNVDVDCLIRAGKSLLVDGGVRAGFGDVTAREHGVVAGEDVRVEGSLLARGDVLVGRDMRVGWGVDIQGRLRCDGDVRARWGLQCERDVQIAGNLQLKDDLDVQADVVCGKAIAAGGTIRVEGELRAGHGIQAGGSIHCGMHVEAGWGIKAGRAIQVAHSLRAGEGVSAQDDIVTGNGYGVFAGLAVHVDSWDTGARVSARHKPLRLMSGCWFDTAVA